MHSTLFDLTGKTALVTAATGGLGFAMVHALAAHGARVVLTGRDEVKLVACIKDLRSEHGAQTIHGLVYDPQDIMPNAAAQLVDRVMSEHGALDVAFINAGTHGAAKLEDWTSAQWSAVLHTNLDASFFLAQQVARVMVLRKSGSIVFTSSLTGLLGRPGIHAYTASKSALMGITRSLAVELAHAGINVNALVPGYFETDLSSGLRKNAAFMEKIGARIPLTRWGKPQDLQGLAVLLASHASSYITGQSFVVDGGLSIAV